MLISHENQFVLFCNESTGSRAVYDTFASLYGATEFSQKHFNRPIPEGTENYLPIITCREPFDRMISAYHRIIEQPVGHAYYGRGIQWDTFEEFLSRYCEWFKASSQNDKDETLIFCKWIAGEFMTIPWPQDFVFDEVVSQCSLTPVFLHQESLQEDVNRLPFYRGEQLPIIGKSDYNRDDFKTPSNIAIVASCLSREYSIFGYSKP